MDRTASDFVPGGSSSSVNTSLASTPLLHRNVSRTLQSGSGSAGGNSSDVVEQSPEVVVNSNEKPSLKVGSSVGMISCFDTGLEAIISLFIKAVISLVKKAVVSLVKKAVISLVKEPSFL